MLLLGTPGAATALVRPYEGMHILDIEHEHGWWGGDKRRGQAGHERER